METFSPLIRTFLFVYGLCIHHSMSQDASSSGNFTCFVCSYSIWQGNNNGQDCLNNTATLSKRSHTLSCDKYCITQERWNTRSKVVDSVFRSCNKFLGNDCAEEYGFVTCITSCRGHYCNNASVGENHDIRLNCNGGICSSGPGQRDSAFTHCLLLFSSFFVYIVS